MKPPSFQYERTLIARGFALIAGVDEAGSGAWAGPVYAAAVILPLNSRLGLIRDSKLLSANQRLQLAQDIKRIATAFAVGVATAEEIDTLNIRRAGLLAMRRAIEQLSPQPHHILSDAFFIPGLTMPCQNVIRGDRLIKSVAAASIIAKTERDQRMKELDDEYPGYHFAQHKGYGTKDHQKNLAHLGPCAIHRKSFEPVKKYF